MVETLVKNIEETLTNDEIQVLTVLEQHAKESVDGIAKRCGFSRQKVWRIVKHLEEKKIIWGYTAITGTEKKGHLGDHFTLLLKRTTIPLEDSMKREVTLEKLDDYLPSGVTIENIIIIHGGWDAIVTFYAPDLITARKVIESMFQRTGKYFKEYLLLEHLFPIRKNRFKNPYIKNLVDYI